MKSLADSFEEIYNEFRAGRYIAAWAKFDVIVAETGMPYTGITELYQAWINSFDNKPVA